MKNRLDAGLILSGLLPLPFYIVPVYAFAPFYPGYSHVSQHASVLAHPDSPVYPYYNVFATVVGLAIVTFSIGLARRLARANRPFASSLFAFVVSGLAFASNGIFPMGSPLHGLYNLAFFSLVGPCIAVMEAGDSLFPRRFIYYTGITTLCGVLYLWASVTGLDPREYAGVTQRVFGCIFYSWFSVAAYELTRKTGTP